MALLLALALGGTAQAQNPGKITVETYQLDNGLTVILSEDHSAQVVAVDVWYHVGSRDERPGRSGFAHLFEHMMFQGSSHVKKGEHFQLIERAGGQMNGTTQTDRTNYFQALPSNRLNLALWLEADRMRSLAVTDSNFHNQRETVKEERRLRVDNVPYIRAFMDELPALFDSATCLPYARSVIGSMDDLNAARTEDVKAFFDLYYTPNNATLTVTGDFEPAEAKRLIRAYFGAIPRGQDAPAVTCTQRFNPGEMRKRVHDDKATIPAVAHAYRVPAYDDADTPALDLLATILGQGESSRLNRKLARDARAALNVQTILNPFGPRRGPGVFVALGIVNQGVAPDSLDRLLAAEIASLAQGGVSAEELTKAQNSYRANRITERQRALSVAEALQGAAFFLGNPEAVNTDIDRYMKVTPEDIKRVAAKYLVPANALILYVSSEAAS
ncbi:MAG: M16 family metallopeptidase [Gemmatimonadaceae bacterium]